jgi:hypothetical protein
MVWTHFSNEKEKITENVLNMKMKGKRPRQKVKIRMGTTDQQRCHAEERKNMEGN